MSAARDAREGVLLRAEGRWRLRFERVLPHAPETVWRALTEEAHLRAWFPTTIEGELRPGAPLRFVDRSGTWSTTGEMLECDPPRLLEFVWGFGDEATAQPEHTRFELTPEGAGCRLVFSTTYDQVGKSARDGAGWHDCLDLLEHELSGTPAPGTPVERWKALNRMYGERFGPEATTIGVPDSMPEYQ